MSKSPESQSEQDAKADRTSWTQAYRIPIVLVSVIVTVGSLRAISGHGAEFVIGWIELALVVAWVSVYAALYRRGY